MKYVKRLKKLAMVKVAVLACNHPDVKNEILVLMKSENYDRKFDEGCGKLKWNEILEKKAELLLGGKFGLPKCLHEDITSLMKPIGLQMLYWAKYVEDNFICYRYLCHKNLNTSHFTSQGTLCKKKAAKDLIKDERFSKVQRYKLACVFCVEGVLKSTENEIKRYAYNLWCKLSRSERQKIYSNCAKESQEMELVRLWTYRFNKNKWKRLTNGKSFWFYGFEKAVESGNLVAVKYCWEKINPRCRDVILLDTAVNLLKRKRNATSDYHKLFVEDMYAAGKKPFVPRDYYIDVLIFLISKMPEAEKKKLYKKDVEINGYSKVLSYLLEWPYQNNFLVTANRLWGDLPERGYAKILLYIVNKIEGSKDRKKKLKCGEESSCNYRVIFREFWRKSPVHYKRYVLSDKMVGVRVFKEGKDILSKLFALENFTPSDTRNIQLVLSCATKEEKENVIFSDDGRNICLKALESGKIKLADLFIQGCSISERKVRQFKEELISCINVSEIHKKFILVDKLSLFDQIVRWVYPIEMQVWEFRKKIASSYKCYIFQQLIFEEQWEKVEQFLTYCFSTEEEMCAFKEREFLQVAGEESHGSLIVNSKWQAAQVLFSWLGLSANGVRELKKRTFFDFAVAKNESFNRNMADKPEQMDLFCRWCFTDSELVKEFEVELRQWRDRSSGEETEFFNGFNLAFEKFLLDFYEDQRGVKRKLEDDVLDGSNKKVKLQAQD
uniref:Uncharacterized protein n=1 Tax=Strigamia maritima TaxID=126957 RepID=T1IT94_STRMM